MRLKNPESVAGEGVRKVAVEFANAEADFRHVHTVCVRTEKEELQRLPDTNHRDTKTVKAGLILLRVCRGSRFHRDRFQRDLQRFSCRHTDTISSLVTQRAANSRDFS